MEKTAALTDALPKTPQSINADMMSIEEFHTEMQMGYNDIKAGRVQDVVEAFNKFRESHFFYRVL